jgi:ATP-dependent Lon protease
MPGRIIQNMRRLKTVNPVFMLDEIDKVGADFRGDPSAALLEALDPEQNHSFSDHYMEVPYDLSNVLFITTANVLYPVPSALRDRMEVIEFSGYIEEEKLAISRQFLIPRQLEEHGLDNVAVKIAEGTIKGIVREYTYEAGVRNLEREIGRICRKLTRRLAESKPIPKTITRQSLHRYLGPPFSLRSFLLISRISNGAIRFSSTVNLRKTDASCARYPIPSLALRYIGNCVMSSLSRKISPALGLINPTIM